MMKRKILFINQSPNRMINDIAREYQMNNWETTLFCGNSPEELDGFNCIENFTPYNKQSIVTRFKSWNKFQIEIFKNIIRKNLNYERVFLVSNPPTLLFKANKIKTLTFATSVHFLMYDLYPDILIEQYGLIGKILAFPIGKMNKVSFKNIDVLFAPSKGLSSAINKYSNKEVNIVYNWVNGSNFEPIQKHQNLFLQKHHLMQNFNVLYSGNLGITHDINTIIKAFELKIDAKIKFNLIGNGKGVELLKQSSLAKAVGLLNCFPLQPESIFKHSIASGDVAIVSYKKGMDGYSIPSKLPYYFSTGTPVIYIGSKSSEVAKIIIENNLGWAIENDDGDSLCNLLNKLVNFDFQEIRINVLKFVNNNWSNKNAQLFYRP